MIHKTNVDIIDIWWRACVRTKVVCTEKRECWAPHRGNSPDLLAATASIRRRRDKSEFVVNKTDGRITETYMCVPLADDDQTRISTDLNETTNAGSTPTSDAFARNAPRILAAAGSFSRSRNSRRASGPITDRGSDLAAVGRAAPKLHLRRDEPCRLLARGRAQGNLEPTARSGPFDDRRR